MYSLNGVFGHNDQKFNQFMDAELNVRFILQQLEVLCILPRTLKPNSSNAFSTSTALKCTVSLTKCLVKAE